MAITNADKQALLNGSATIPFKINIIQDGQVIKTLDEHSIVSLNHEDFRYVNTESLCIGQFVARKITGTLDQIYTEFEIEDTELELQMGIAYDGNVNYYSLGNFLVTKPSTDDVKDKTSFEAMDYTKKFNVTFDDSNLTYPCTALQLAQECCRQVGVELATTDFANYDFQIPNNQYMEGDTCRKVMQDIGKLAYSWVRIGWDNKCYIDFEIENNVEEYNTITNKQYYDLSLQKKAFGPVNRVVIGIKDVEGENAVIEDSASIEENGVTEIQLYNSNITYTPELRLQAIQAATRLFGLTYIPLDMNTIGHPWLVGNEKIEIVNMNGDSLYTYPWDRTIVYNGHIKSRISSKADTKTETEYRNYGDLETSTRQTRIIVDKQNTTIEALAEQVQPISDTITGNNTITLVNAYEGTLHRLEITGNITPLVPSESLVPSGDLVPYDATILLVDDTEYSLGMNYLEYINSSTHDTYIYEDGKQWIERIDGTIEELEDLVINISSSSTITFVNRNVAHLKCTYLLQNEYTDTFAPTVDLVSKINLSPGQATISARKIKLEGYTTINENFGVDLQGNMWAKNGSFEGNVYLPDGGKVIGGDGLLTNLQFLSTGMVNGWGPIGFNIDDSNNVLYQDLVVDYSIPENFTIESAYLTLYTSSVMSQYVDMSTYASIDTTGTPKQLKLYEGSLDQTFEIFLASGTSYFYRGDLSVGNEVGSAFGSSSYTPSISYVGDVDSVTSINLSNILSTTVGNNQLIVRTNVTKPSNYSTTANRKSIAENTGIGRLVLNIIGYISKEEEEGE